MAHRLARQHRAACAAARGFGHQAGFEQQLVALQHHVFVPGGSFQPEGDGGALMTAGPHGRIGAVFAPGCQLRHDQFFDQRFQLGARDLQVQVLRTRGIRRDRLPSGVAAPARPWTGQRLVPS
ncbi:hypothetical protein G6F22_019707 [Rhizopus arrhizus]|nr:hypothetical protein G6F22_019707 [Rhizopus arrhizus]